MPTLRIDESDNFSDRDEDESDDTSSDEPAEDRESSDSVAESPIKMPRNSRISHTSTQKTKISPHTRAAALEAKKEESESSESDETTSGAGEGHAASGDSEEDDKDSGGSDESSDSEASGESDAESASGGGDAEADQSSDDDDEEEEDSDDEMVDAEPEIVKETLKKPRDSAPRLVRDLLPVSLGPQNPNAHSIFAQPLISEGEDDGRRLRKRKSPTGELPPMPEKRRRKSAAASTTSPPQPTAMPDSKGESESEPTARASRRVFQRPVPPFRIIQHRPFDKPPPHKFILAFHLGQDKIGAILSKPPRPRKSSSRRKRPPKIPPPPIIQVPIPKFPALPTHHLIFPSALTERENELNAKPYGGILSEAEADTTRSLPQFRDREIFESARKEAEEERRRASAAADAQVNGDGTGNASRANRTVSGPPSKIKCIQFGKFVIDTFYAAPYPEEYSHESRLFICEFCLKYLPSEFVAYRHKLKCPAKHPPGDEIYREGSVSIWEVDGRKKTEYCQCLCLMAKMFLGSKTLYYDVEPFLFYILTEYDEFGYHFVGYFSKEKRPASLNNVSCILVMPIHQRKGYATFLIDFSYLLTRIEGKEGSPEKPLSDMGLTAYRSYWDLTISRHLLDLGLQPFSTKTLMDRTGMTADDVIHSLERLYAFIRDPVTKIYAIRFDRTLYENIVHEYESKGHRKLQPGKLVWTPYIMGRSDQATLDGQPMQTVAPREDHNESVAPEGITTNFDETHSNSNGDSSTPLNVDDLLSENLQEKLRSAGRTRTRSARVFSQPRDEDKKKASRESSSRAGDPDAELRDVNGQIAPGPPSTGMFNNNISTEITQSANRILNGHISSQTSPKSAKVANPAEEEKPLTGYALAFRTHNVPPTRFQIEPPIPSSMLRKKRKIGSSAFGAARRRPGMNGAGTGTATPLANMVPVRSSPRHVAGLTGKEIDGSIGMLGDDLDRPSTPSVRRSARGSRLATTQLMSLDGAGDITVVVDHTNGEDVDEDAEGARGVADGKRALAGAATEERDVKPSSSEEEEEGQEESGSGSGSASGTDEEAESEEDDEEEDGKAEVAEEDEEEEEDDDDDEDDDDEEGEEEDEEETSEDGDAEEDEDEEEDSDEE